MSKFDEFLKSQIGKPPRKGDPIDGCFGCQVCDETVDEAEYFRVERLLKWTCSQGHVSFIEEFTL